MNNRIQNKENIKYNDSRQQNGETREASGTMAQNRIQLNLNDYINDHGGGQPNPYTLISFIEANQIDTRSKDKSVHPQQATFNHKSS